MTEQGWAVLNPDGEVVESGGVTEVQLVAGSPADTEEE